jgi:predicted transposase YdaD
MAEPIYDLSSKWLLEHQGRAITLLGGRRDVISCKAVQSEVVQPRQLPDGLLEVRLRGQREPALMLVEFCTYPEKRVVEQMMDGLRLVRQVRGVLPDGLALVLCPKGQYRVPQEGTTQSALGWSKELLSWKVVEVWTLPAEELLTSPDVGVVPLVPLMAFQGPPEAMLRRCRERIDREAGAMKANMLAVAQTLAKLRFPQQEFLDLFGGSRAMIESPLIKEIVEQAQQQTRRTIIEEDIKDRFGPLPDSARASLEGVTDPDMLRVLRRFANTCSTLEAFLERLAQETTPAPAPVSSRRQRKR